jgi:hypothetical protein
MARVGTKGRGPQRGMRCHNVSETLSSGNTDTSRINRSVPFSSFPARPDLMEGSPRWSSTGGIWGEGEESQE